MVNPIHAKSEAFQEASNNAKHSGQCKLSQASFRAVPGIRLALSLKEVEKTYPDAEFWPINSFGFTRVFIHSDVKNKGLGFNKRVKDVELGFLDGVLVYADVLYGESEWLTLNSFISQVTSEMRVRSTWSMSYHVNDPSFETGGRLICGRFEVLASVFPLRDISATNPNSKQLHKRSIVLTMIDARARGLVESRVAKRARSYQLIKDSDRSVRTSPVYSYSKPRDFFGQPHGFERLHIFFKQQATLAKVQSLLLSYDLPFESIEQKQSGVHAIIYVPDLYTSQWLKIFESVELVQACFVGREDHRYAWLQTNSEVSVGNRRYLLGAANATRVSADMRNRISAHFRHHFADKGKLVEERCGPLCLNFIVRELRGEVITSHRYWERLKLQVIFVPKSQSQSVDMYFMIDGKYGTGFRPPAERSYLDMESQYYEQLSNYLNQLSTGVHGMFR